MPLQLKKGAGYQVSVPEGRGYSRVHNFVTGYKLAVNCVPRQLVAPRQVAPDSWRPTPGIRNPAPDTRHPAA